MASTAEGRERQRTRYDAFMLALSAYVLVQLAIEVIVPLPVLIAQVFFWTDFVACIVFLLDWVWHFAKAERKWAYATHNLLHLLSAIPFAQALRPLRVLRVVRLARSLRIVRGLKGALPMAAILLKNPARSVMTVYGTLTFLVYFYCSIGLYNFERELNDRIESFGDVLWMSFTTLTTVGYGDIYPVTTGGRLMAAILVLLGMGLFSVMTAEIATFILRFTRGGSVRADSSEEQARTSISE